MTVTGQEITDYVDRVRAALADLPPTVRDELTEDLPEHLTEVAAEAEGTLVDRLGEPEAYAAELRAAAGAESGVRPGLLGRRLAGVRTRSGTQLRALDRQLGPLFGYASVSEFLRLLRPAWWVLRGYLAAALLATMAGGDLSLLPRPFLSEVGGLVLLAAAVLGSIALGRNADRLRGWPRRLTGLGTVVLAFFGLVLLVNLDERSQRDGFGYQEVSVGDRYDSIQDVFVYDESDRLVTNARLFDQNGVPIRLGWPTCDRPHAAGLPRDSYPYCPEQAPYAPVPPPGPAHGVTSTPTAPAAPTGGATPTPADPSAPAPATPDPSAPTPVPTR
ncbi:HAAS signaling domain-containing protein [Micromonospora auratinigra]|uniref:Uncharacterized protein n=1 Tax=Micromonospora auratinigra TaxID=261654 RepID=A0A1A9A749_9ACTN|nr:hypothetical protein [Micromonospora auratinigra]SBT51998.1 hypothetical protein GA0070611_5444 [Micromonospora auratinigra]